MDEVARALVGGCQVNIISNAGVESHDHRASARCGAVERRVVHRWPGAGSHRVRGGREATLMRWQPWTTASRATCRELVTHVNSVNLHELEAFCAEIQTHGVAAWQIQIGTPTGSFGHHRELVIRPRTCWS